MIYYYEISWIPKYKIQKMERICFWSKVVWWDVKREEKIFRLYLVGKNELREKFNETNTKKIVNLNSLSGEKILTNACTIYCFICNLITIWTAKACVLNIFLLFWLETNIPREIQAWKKNKLKDEKTYRKREHQVLVVSGIWVLVFRAHGNTLNENILNKLWFYRSALYTNRSVFAL